MSWRGPSYDGEFPSLGWEIVDWIEHYLCHGPGDVAGEPIVLDDEFVEFFVKAYRIDPETGRRIYRRAFLSRPKGRAKSELAGMASCAEGRGPVRFAGWDANGEPVGKPVKSPFIRCMATEEGQAGNTYDNVTMMLDHLSSNFGDEYPGIDLGNSSQSSTRIFFADGGEIRPSTASDASKDGGKESFVVFDETHLLILPSHKRMHATIRRNLRKRKAAEPWALETSTMYQVGQDSVAEQTHKYAKAIAEGKVKETGLLFDHKQADDVDLADKESILKGLAHVYGPFSEHMDFDGIVAEIFDPQSSPSDSRRFWFNCPTSAEDAWLAEHELSAVFDPDYQPTPGDLIGLGFDGSRSRARGVTDATALIAYSITDQVLFPIGIWEQPEGPAGDDWQVPEVEVDAAVRDTFKTYNVAGFFADPARWEGWIAKWESDFGSKLKVRSTRNHPIQWWMTGGRSSFIVRATEQLHSLIVQEDIRITSYPMLRHFTNARRRASNSGVQIAKEFPDSPNKIDAAVASILAVEAGTQAIAAGVTRRKRTRKLTRY